MINLAKQNQYVEFAEKDSKGRNIAEKIDELKNKPAGTKLYLHIIRLVNPDDKGTVFLNIINNREYAIADVEELKTMLRDSNFNNMRQPLLTIGGRYKASVEGANYYPQGIYCTDNNVLGLLVINPNTGDINGIPYGYPPRVTDFVTAL